MPDVGSNFSNISSTFSTRNFTYKNSTKSFRTHYARLRGTVGNTFRVGERFTVYYSPDLRHSDLTRTV